MIIGLLEEKLVLFIYEVIMKTLCGVGIQMILLEKCLGLLKIVKGNDFVFERVELMDYKLHRVRLRRGGSYTKSPEWLLHKRATINPKNKRDY